MDIISAHQMNVGHLLSLTVAIEALLDSHPDRAALRSAWNAAERRMYAKLEEETAENALGKVALDAYALMRDQLMHRVFESRHA
jgi:hypothetical protein